MNQREYMAVLMSESEALKGIQEGTVMYWKSLHMVVTKEPTLEGMLIVAGTYVGTELFGMRTESLPGFKGVFIQTKGGVQ